MRIGKVVSLGFVALGLHLAGCASATDPSSTEENPSAPSASAAPEAGNDKSTFAAPLPDTTDEQGSSSEASGDEGSGEVHVDDPTTPAGDDDDDNDNAPPVTTPKPPVKPPVTTPPVTPKAPDPGPAPTGTCSVSKDSLGFFTRSSGKSDYVAFVPASYNPKKPMRVVVGMHGCGDNALNFAKWAVSPWATRSSQTHIGLSIGGRDGTCWSKGIDDDKVLAAVDDIAKCFWVDRSKVVIAGYSSGGELAYRVGMQHADKLAGILIENSSISSSGIAPATLLKSASWKINVAHSAHTGDTTFPIKTVEADWGTIKGAGFPLKTQELPGGHDGVGSEWSDWLIPASAGWQHP